MSVSEPGREHVQTSPPAGGQGAPVEQAPAYPSSSASPEGQEGSRRLLLFGVLLGVFVVGAAVALFATSRTGTEKAQVVAVNDNSPVQALRPLTRQRDLTSCRNALQQLNSLASTDASHSSGWEGNDRQAVVEVLGLDARESAELDAHDYTLLDGQYLDECMLLRDVARTLNGEEEEATRSLEEALASLGTNEAGFPRLARTLVQRRLDALRLEQARAAFDWTVRQVRLQPHSPLYVTPPAFTLRRGTGTDLERALVFLALLRQVGSERGLTGCLVFCKEADGQDKLWACGVVSTGDDRLFLFDPRIGLPIPGPGGVGVATLNEALHDPTVLARLTVDKEQPYDITPERAATAEVRQYGSLSGVTPRMRSLEGLMQTAGVPAHLWIDAVGDRRRLTQAARAALGDKAQVQSWAMVDESTREKKKIPGALVLQRFLPDTEGGQGVAIPVMLGPGQVLNLPLAALYTRELLQGNLPAPFDDRSRFPPEVGLGQRIHSRYTGYFITPLLEPGKPRDLMLRGDFSAAGPAIGENIHQFDERVDRAAKDPDLRTKVDKWVQEVAIPVYAKLVEEENKKGAGDPDELAEARQKADSIWYTPEALDVKVLLDAGSSQNVLPELAYLQARCKHEQAEQLQARIDRQLARGQLPNQDEWEDIHSTWLAARGLWREYLEVRSRERNSVARIASYRSWFRTIRQCGDPPSPTAAASFLLSTVGARTLPALTSFEVLSVAESQRLRGRLLEEMEKALGELEDLKTASSDRTVNAYIGYERVALLYLRHQLRQGP